MSVVKHIPDCLKIAIDKDQRNKSVIVNWALAGRSKIIIFNAQNKAKEHKESSSKIKPKWINPKKNNNKS